MSSLLSGLRSLTLQATPQPAPAPIAQPVPVPATGINAMPRDLVKHVYSFLDFQDGAKVHEVSKAWNTLPHWSTLQPRVDNKGCLDLSGLPNLSSKNLKIILAATKKSSKITSINLSNCKNITDADLALLVKRFSLRSLDLSGCKKITDAGLAHLAMCDLRSLDLSGCTKITEYGLPHLVRHASLSSLNLRGCTNIKDDSLVHLKPLRRSLVSVQLDGSGVTLAAAKAFQATLG